MRKLQILGQRKTRGSNSLSGPHHADKIDFEQKLTLQGGGRMLRAEGCVQLPLDHSFVGSILPLGHFQSYVGRSAAYSPDEGQYQRCRCMVPYRQSKSFLASLRIEILSAHHRLEPRQK